MKKACTLCGSFHYETFAFKGGYICENCLRRFKAPAANGDHVRINR